MVAATSLLQQHLSLARVMLKISNGHVPSNDTKKLTCDGKNISKGDGVAKTDRMGCVQLNIMDAHFQNGNDMCTVPFIKLSTNLLFEIFKLLNPFDLLQLARTSKALRIILMNRSSQLIWAEAKANVKGLPRCPNILSQPAYAELMFNENCSQCSASSPTVVSWGLLSRWCKECAESEFETAKVKYKVGNLSLASFLPHISFFYPGQSDEPVTLYHTDSLLHWRGLSRSEKDAWLSEKALVWKENEKQITACTIWVQRQTKRHWKLDREHTLDELVKELELLGWGDEIAKSIDLNMKLAKYVYERGMPDEVWEIRKHDFIGVMKREKAAREKRERSLRTSEFQRLTILEVIRRLALLGWSDEMANTTELSSKLSPFIVYGQDMTDQVWESRKHDFIGVMKRQRAHRLRLELDQIV